MKTKNIFFAFLFSLLFSSTTYAINTPIIREVPTTIDATTYILHIYTEPGATVTITGGPYENAPITDGEKGDEVDGVIDYEIALTQEASNVFSIVAEKNDDVSDSVIITIQETSKNTTTKTGDTTPPAAPQINPIPDFVSSKQFIITGKAEANANINIRNTLGTIVSSTKAGATGFFQVKVNLEENKTNRFNISAEDEAGNEGEATQAVIRMSEDLAEPTDEPMINFSTSAQLFFNDIEGHWAESYIERLYIDKVVTGKSKGVFDPDGYISRAEITKIALLAFGHSVNTSVEVHPFSDVPKNAWFAPYIEEAKRLNIVQGLPSGGFYPNNYITRSAALKIILKASGLEIKNPTSVKFADVPLDSWFAPFVTFAEANGIVKGYEDSTFKPEEFVTRAQVAKMVVKTLELKK